MANNKRMATIETGFGNLNVRLFVTEHNYQIKVTKAFGRVLPITLLSRDIVNSSSTVDELLDRYLSRVSVVDTTDYNNSDNMDASCDIIVSGTSGTHKITISTVTEDDSIRFTSTGFDGEIKLYQNGNSTCVEHSCLVTPRKRKTISVIEYRYDDDNEVVSVDECY